MERKRVKKVAKLDKNPSQQNEEEVKVDDGGGDERNDDGICHMDKLPNEILMKILDYLDEQKLVKCRLVSCRWNEICCLLLQDKTYKNPRTKLRISLSKARDKQTYDFYLECSAVITKPFDEFLDCFFPSGAEKTTSTYRPRPFPFSCLHMGGLVCLTYDQLTKLALAFRHIKSVFFYLCKQDAEATGTVWRLLLKFAPNIERVGFNGDYNLACVNLFEPYFNFTPNSNPEDEMQNQNYSFLKNLKVLDITTSSWLDSLEGFLHGIFDNTPNLEQVILHNKSEHDVPKTVQNIPFGVKLALIDAGLNNKVTIKHLSWP